jgi:hypothetical protein
MKATAMEAMETTHRIASHSPTFNPYCDPGLEVAYLNDCMFMCRRPNDQCKNARGLAVPSTDIQGTTEYAAVCACIQIVFLHDNPCLCISRGESFTPLLTNENKTVSLRKRFMPQKR